MGIERGEIGGFTGLSERSIQIVDYISSIELPEYHHIWKGIVVGDILELRLFAALGEFLGAYALRTYFDGTHLFVKVMNDDSIG